MSKAKSDKSNSGLALIPWYSIMRIGKIFVEGLRYGRDNWKKGVNDKEYQEERLEHAMVHLIKYKEGDTTEDHLAKVAWFCVTQMELMRLEQLEPAQVAIHDSEEEIVENAPDVIPIQLPINGGVIYRNREGRDVAIIEYDQFGSLLRGKTIDRPDNEYYFTVSDSGLLIDGQTHYTDLVGELKDQGKYNK